MGGRQSGDYPRTLAEFYRRFPDDDACLLYLAETRWPHGFRCPVCGGQGADFLTARRLWQCRVRTCRRQTSAAAGTALHRSKLPLTTWFTAAYLVATLKPGISALQLKSQLGMTRLETAWLLLHKLRAAMVDPDRSPLSGVVEVDETWVGGKQKGLRGGRQRRGRKALTVMVAVERRAGSLGRLRLEVIHDTTGTTLYDFIKRNVRPGSTVVSDAWTGYTGIEPEVYSHESVSQAAQRRAGGDPSAVPGVDRVISNLKTWLRGTHHGVGADHLDAYLDEFVFRFNRRRTPMAGFATLLGIGTAVGPTTGDEIRSPLTAGSATRRRGRATGLTSARHPNPPADGLDADGPETTLDPTTKPDDKETQP